MDITLDAVKNIELLCKTEEITMFYQEFGDSSIIFLLRLWIASPEQPDYLHVGSQTIVKIKTAHDKILQCHFLFERSILK